MARLSGGSVQHGALTGRSPARRAPFCSAPPAGFWDINYCMTCNQDQHRLLFSKKLLKKINILHLFIRDRKVHYERNFFNISKRFHFIDEQTFLCIL